ncbi:LPXTG cell wall anchor domain-containing protein [Streptomyces sp. NPDC006602]|uniref:LPXTG cell wall anchor domain-containing protein n=1 Tax=Streptomyces sp. NPDC006602 TaxID=3364751 RepID=UPI0036BD933E
MINRRRKAGAVLAAFAAAVAAWLPATSAQAADGPVVHIYVRSDNIGLPVPPSQDPPQISWGLKNDGPGTAKDVTISADLSDVKDWVTVNGKSVDTFTWPARADVPEGDNAGYIADVNAKPGTPLGTTGTVTLSGTSSNGTVVSIPIKLTAGTTELKVNKLPDRKGDKPGSTVEAPVTISNTGSLPADGVQLRMLTTLGLSYTDRFSNCVYSTVTSGPNEYYATQQALCTFDTVVEPGKSYRLDRPVALDVTKQALLEYFGREALPLSGGAGTPPSGNGPALSLVPAGAAATDGQEIGRQRFDVANTADMVAGGDTAEGAPGDLVHVDVSLSNKGPARVGYFNGDFFPTLVLTVPTGTKAVEIPDGCSVWVQEASSGSGEKTPGAPQYLCYPDPKQFTVGDTRSYRFGLQIRDNAVTTTGEAQVSTPNGSALSFDDKQGNNTAAVTVKVKGSGAPAPGASASASTVATADGNTPGTQTVATDAADDTGSLASTGGSGTSFVAAAAGAVALLLGGALVLLVRRNRA